MRRQGRDQGRPGMASGSGGGVWALLVAGFALHALVIGAATTAALPDAGQPYFPVFHIRPPNGHVNDPNGPFRDPTTGYVHLLMQYCPQGPCAAQSAPIVPGQVPNYQDATHFYTKDLVRWAWTGPQGGVVAGGKAESATDCPDDHGVYSGSTTIINGTIFYAYPGVHLNPHPWKDGKRYPTMTQCLAFPADPSDPELRVWNKTTIIPSGAIPHGLSQHLHDDSEAFFLHGRWWLFLGGRPCGGKATGDCPFPDPTVTAAYGVNYLFSAEDIRGPWRPEHSLYNDTQGFVSCPEFYHLPTMAPQQYVYHAMNGRDKIGTFDPVQVRFIPDTERGYYDNADGHASKSFWDEATGRRIMWSWINGRFPCSNAAGIECDSMQSVPREIRYDAALRTLLITPVAEVARLRTGQLASKTVPLASGGASPPVALPVNSTTLDVLANFTCAPGKPGDVCAAAVQVRAAAGSFFQVGFKAVFGVPGANASVVVAAAGATLDARVPGQQAPRQSVSSSSSLACSGAGGATGPCPPDQGAPHMGFPVPFAAHESFDGHFALRLLVDRPVVEIYAMGGRAVGTFMHLPTAAAAGGVRVLGLEASAVNVVAGVTVFGMGTAFADAQPGP